MMNPQLKEFYVSMGYSQQQVIRAYEYATKQQIDILDALTYISKKPQYSQPLPAKKQNNFINPQQKISIQNKNSFLIPSSKIKFSDYEIIYSINNKQNILNSKHQLRQANTPVGLLNISNCCYLNSLLQCYFLMEDFKIALLSAQPIQNIEEILAENKTKLKRVKNQFELLNKIKRFFTKMSITSKKFLDPTQILQNLVDSVGQKISYGQEKDLSQINIMIIQRISEGLSFCRQYYDEQQNLSDLKGIDVKIGKAQQLKRYNSIYNPKTGTIKKLFYGIKVEYYDNNELQNEPPIVSDFAGIILNPRFGTLYNALEQQFNFSVQINNKIIKKQIFIRQVPQYLFMYINRTQFDRDMGQMHKNEQKFSFDFTFYIDRYLQKYRGQKNQKDIIITQLVQNRNRIKEQINNLQLLYKKMEECYKYALQLQGWQDKLPSQEDFEKQYHILKENLDEVERDLEKIESREEKYHLMYIFVHRGDAASGHYWGYGRNGLKWYKFDIKCRQIQQQQILIDIQKASSTPYALLYVKQSQLPNFSYSYYLQRANFQQNLSKTNEFLDLNLAQQIIKQNILMHNEIKMRNIEIFKKKSYLDYLARYKSIKAIYSRQQQQMAKIKHPKFTKMYFQYCLNFSTFLIFKGEHQLCKFTIFQQSILFASGNKIDSQKLLKDKSILEIIQKKFIKSCKGDFYLRNYAVVGKDLQKYRRLYQEYQLQLFQIIWSIFLTQQYDKLCGQLIKFQIKTDKFCVIEIKEDIKTYLISVLRLLSIRTFLKRHEEYKNAEKLIENQLYLSKVNDEISKLALLKLVIYGFKFENMSMFIDLSDISVQQIAIINAKNSINIPKLNQNPPSAIQSSRNWISNYFKKTVKRSSLNNEKNLSQKKSQRKISNSQISPLKSSLFTSTSGKKIEIQDKKQQNMISKNQNLLILDLRQNWKIQDLENGKKFNISERIKNFLEKMGNILQFYKAVISQNKRFSIEEILQKGIILNQERHEQQSLI